MLLRLTQTDEETIGGNSVGKELEALHLDSIDVLEKPSNPDYYPKCYLVHGKDREELIRKDNREFRNWILAMNKTYDIILDLHDNTLPNDKKLLRSVQKAIGDSGRVMPEGYTAIDSKEHPDWPFAYVGLHSNLPSSYLTTTLDLLRKKTSLPLDTMLYKYPIFDEPCGVVEGAIEFYFARITKRRPLTIEKYDVALGTTLVANLVQLLREQPRKIIHHIGMNRSFHP